MFKKFKSNPEHNAAIFAMRGNKTESARVQLDNDMSAILNKEEFIKKLEKSELLSICYPSLKGYLDQDTLDYAILNYENVDIRISNMFDQLRLLGHRFASRKLKVVALKNGGLAQFHINNLGEHPMGDIDLMVSKSDFFKAHQEIIDSGFELEFRSEHEENTIESAFINGGAEYSKKLTCGNIMWLELAYRSVSGRWIDQKKEPAANDLLCRAISAPISGIYILAPEDNLLQVAIHTAKHTYFRAPGIRLHLDVHRVCSLFEIDWLLFKRLVKESETQTAVYFSLLCSKELLGTHIPESILSSIKPAFWKIMLFQLFFRNVKIGERFKPNRIAFIIFQTCLYDNFNNFQSVLFSSPGKIKKEGHSVFYSYLIHWADLIGIRKRYKK